MPTIRPHEHRQVAESFGTDPERYDRARPGYPDALVERIVAGSPGRNVLNVGCGTGIEARQFQAAGCTMLGVEPDARMAGFARRTGLDVEVSTFEAWDPDGRLFDAIIAGTAWHWVDPLKGAAKAAQVLRPDGLLTPFWHVAEPPPEVTEAFLDAYQRVVPNSPFALPKDKSALDIYLAGLVKVSEGIREAGGFSEPEQWQFAWQREYTREEWLDYLPTTGGLTRLRPDQLAEVLDAVGAAIGTSVTVQYTTVAINARRERP